VASKMEAKFNFLIPSIKIRGGMGSAERDDQLILRPNLWYTYDGRLLCGLEDYRPSKNKFSGIY